MQVHPKKKKEKDAGLLTGIPKKKYTVGTTLNLQGGVFYFGKGPDLCPNSGAPNYFGDLD